MLSEKKFIIFKSVRVNNYYKINEGRRFIDDAGWAIATRFLFTRVEESPNSTEQGAG